MAVLRFINNTKSRFKVFVANRLSIIHEFTTPSQWQYVKTEENPADLASRGVSPDDLKRLQFWLDGPYFLLHSNITYVTPSDTNEDNVTAEEAAEGKDCCRYSKSSYLTCRVIDRTLVELQQTPSLYRLSETSNPSSRQPLGR